VLIRTIFATDDYQQISKYEEGYFADKLGLTVEQERAILSELVAVGLIYLEDEKYQLSEEGVEVYASPFQSGDVKKYIIDLIQERFQQQQVKSSFLILPISAERERLISEKMEKMFREIVHIAHEADEGEIRNIRIVSALIMDPIFKA
jgi:hypothetical protein